MERRLAAIMASDIVGFSRMMGADEAGTLAALQGFRTTLFDPIVECHQGRIVKLMGDGALVAFESVVAAVECAAEIQRRLAARNADRPETERLELRIGINLGDFIVDGDDLYGDGVNVAARLEPLAAPGGILVSGAVAAQVAGRVSLALEDLGPRQLKNIAEPVQVFQVVVGVPSSPPPVAARGRKQLPWAGLALAGAALALMVWQLALAVLGPAGKAFDEEAVLAHPAGPTVAVLPFDNLSGDVAKTYISEGIGEDIIVELGRYPDLNVLSRQTTAAYRERYADVREIGSALGADYVLEGSVRQARERMRVTARLIDAGSRRQVWSAAFDERLTASNLFDVQRQITEQVAASVGDAGGAIRRIEERRARTKPPEKLSSYECTIYRVDFYDKPDAQRRVHACIGRVIEEEPGYWRGWAQLAEALRTDVMFFGDLYSGSHPEKLQRAQEAAERAVTLNPDAPRAWFVLGHVRLLRGDRSGFYEAAERALLLGGDRRIEGQIGYYFVWTGRIDLGEKLLRRAIRLEPKSAEKLWHQGLAEVHFYRDEFEKALSEARIGYEPRGWWSVVIEVAAAAKLGRLDDVAAARERLDAARSGVKISDIVWIYRRFQRPDPLIAKWVDAYRLAGLEEGTYAPLNVGD